VLPVPVTGIALVFTFTLHSVRSLCNGYDQADIPSTAIAVLRFNI
jgi:hypothetical protein